MSGMGLYGSTLTSLQYQPHAPTARRASFARDQSIGSGMGDDLSLVGECDVSSTRSDKHRPGRRASLSAAIELTRTPPKRYASASKPRGRRNSLFGNKKDSNNLSDDGKDKDRDAHNNSEALAKLSIKKSKGGRRASMAGYPVAGTSSGIMAAEPEPTPQFFAKKKKGSKKDHNNKEGPRDHRGLPKKSRSFDKTDPRAKSMLSSLGKIKRPKGGGSRRASMSGVPAGLLRKGGLTRGGSKNSDLESFRSVHSNSSSYDCSDDESHASDIFLHGPIKKAPPRSSSFGAERSKQQFRIANAAAAAAADTDLGYGDPTAYDPQLPPPPPPVKAVVSKRAMQNRRGSTGAAVSGFRTTASAQKSLKESIQWKQQVSSTATIVSPAYSHANHHASHSARHQQYQAQHRRASAASSVANSVATDVASNVQTNPNTITTFNSSTMLGPSDVPPVPQRRSGSPSPADDRDVVDHDMDVSMTLETPPQSNKAKLPSSMLMTPTGMLDDGDNDDDDNDDNETPLQSNRKTRTSIMTMNGSKSGGGLNGSKSGLLVHVVPGGAHGGHMSSLGLMDESMNSETSEDEGDHDPLTAVTTTAAGRRANRGLSRLQTTPPASSSLRGPAGGGSSGLPSVSV